ncbi:hypothetical protein D3C85_1197090 [compost metagenome]
MLEKSFKDFPDSHDEMRRQGLAYFRYFVTEQGIAARSDVVRPRDLDSLVAAGHVRFEPLVYEDFLPVSAAGIFQSNLGDSAQTHYGISSNQTDFHAALGARVLDELQLYADTQRRSILECSATLNLPPLV